MKLPEINIINCDKWYNWRGKKTVSPKFVLTYELTLNYLDYGESNINQQTYPLSKNMILFKRPGDIVQNTFYNISNPAAKCCLVHFVNLSENYSSLFESILRKMPPCTEADEQAVLLFEKLYFKHTKKSNPVTEMQECLTLIELLAHLSEKANIESLSSPTPSTHQTQLFRAICYMREHLTDNFSLHDVASHIGYSLSYFNNLFKKYTRHTPYAYFNYLRISEAKYMLLNTSLSIAEIADRLNFKNASKFSEAFKRECNMTPGQFRKSSKIELYN